MDVRARINQIITDTPGLSVRSVSLAAGLSDSMLHKFLSGQTDSLTIKTAEKLADALNVDARWLIFGEGEPDQATDVADRISRLSEEHRQLVSQLVEQLARTGTYG